LLEIISEISWSTEVILWNQFSSITPLAVSIAVILRIVEALSELILSCSLDIADLDWMAELFAEEWSWSGWDGWLVGRISWFGWISWRSSWVLLIDWFPFALGLVVTAHCFIINVLAVVLSGIIGRRESISRYAMEFL
jgi:hypothetical protein